MSNFIADIRESAREIKNVRSLTGGAMLTALNLILNYTRIIISSVMEISFAFLAIAVSGMLYGPVTAGIIGALADVLLKPGKRIFLPGIYIKCIPFRIFVRIILL